MSDAEERLLTFSREVYSDHRDRHGRAQQIALGLLAFNGVLVGFLATAIWQISQTTGTVSGWCLWLLVAGLILAFLAAGVHIYVATRIKVAWPDPLRLCETLEKHSSVGEPMFLARIYANAVAQNQPHVDNKFRLIGAANICTGLTFVLTLVALIVIVS
ncbi:MAG: hypothetical protein ACOX9R_09325 [Armatimonadota bacterium]|jgi:hypothetical protein